MSALIDALKAARELLAGMPTPDGYYLACTNAITELDAALAAAEAQPPEPVAWAITDCGNVIYLNDSRKESSNEFRKYGSRSRMELVPLYAAPVAQPVVPQGWRLVPVEPTREMLNAGILRHQDAMGSIGAAYRAMCAAAPAAPAAQPLTDEQVEKLIHATHFDARYVKHASDRVCLDWYRLGLRDGERAHGIGSAA